jgi:hypothetical protein
VTSTNTNKQPVFIDRPLFNSVLLTSQIGGSVTNNTLFVQGGQQPALLVDMDALLTNDSNSGGTVDTITLTRNDFFRPVDHAITDSNDTTPIVLNSGMIVSLTTDANVSGTLPSGAGFYTYTGATFTGAPDQVVANQYSSIGPVYPNQPMVTVVFYQSRGTTTPIPASGDYKVLFSVDVPANQTEFDCGSEMFKQNVPVPTAGNTTGLGETVPLRMPGIYMQRGDRLYAGVFPGGPWASGYSPGITCSVQGGFY